MLMWSRLTTRQWANVSEVLGASAVMYGCWLVWPPLAWLAGGVFAFWVS